jgi:hypothetical protein
VHHLEAGVAHVIEDVAGEQGRRDHEDHVEQDDRPEADANPDGVGEGEHAEVAEAEHDEDDAELGAAERQIESMQRPPQRVGQPVMDVERRPVVLRRGAGGHQEAGHHHPAKHCVRDQGSPPGLQAGQRGQRRADHRRLDRRVSGCGSGLHRRRGS